MNSFPNILHVNNRNMFINLNNQRILEKFREYVYLHMIQNFHSDKDENRYVDIDVFCKNNMLNNRNEKIIQEIVQIVRKELEDLGWKTALSFGDTGLFIYSTVNKPSSCW